MQLVDYRAGDLPLKHRAAVQLRSGESQRESGSAAPSAAGGTMSPERAPARARTTHPTQEYPDRLHELVPRLVRESLASADATYAIERRLHRAYEQRETLENYRMGGDT